MQKSAKKQKHKRRLLTGGIIRLILRELTRVCCDQIIHDFVRFVKSQKSRFSIIFFVKNVDFLKKRKIFQKKLISHLTNGKEDAIITPFVGVCRSKKQNEPFSPYRFRARMVPISSFSCFVKSGCVRFFCTRLFFYGGIRRLAARKICRSTMRSM